MPPDRFNDRQLRRLLPAETRPARPCVLRESETDREDPAPDPQHEDFDELEPAADEEDWREVDERLLDAFDDEQPEPEPGDFDWPRHGDEPEER